MTITKHDHCAIWGNTSEFARLWCVYEHWITPGDDQPPQLIYVNACKLCDVFTMEQARQNSDWHRLTVNGRLVMVRIVATGTNRLAVQQHAVAHIKAMASVPRCNLHGYNMNGASRPLLCSNGETYRNQSEAARVLNLSQSHISRHMRGQLETVKGYTFTYATGMPNDDQQD